MRTKASKALTKILFAITIPRLNDKCSYAEIQTKFPIVVVRDALVELGVNFDTAEHLAAENSGCARVRFGKCLRRLNINRPEGD